ncbi:MAG: hypothetical protein QXZ08_05060 [Nitrososphaeria archaeon]
MKGILQVVIYLHIFKNLIKRIESEPKYCDAQILTAPNLIKRIERNINTAKTIIVSNKNLIKRIERNVPPRKPGVHSENLIKRIESQHYQFTVIMPSHLRIS